MTVAHLVQLDELHQAGTSVSTSTNQDTTMPEPIEFKVRGLPKATVGVLSSASGIKIAVSDATRPELLIEVRLSLDYLVELVTSCRIANGVTRTLGDLIDEQRKKRSGTPPTSEN